MKIFLFLFFPLLSLSLLDGQEVTTLHRNAIVADTHNDVLLRAMAGEDLAVRTTHGHSDIIRMMEGGIDVQIFSVWCGENYANGRAYQRANAMIDSLESIIQRSKGKAVLVKTPRELDDALRRNQIASLIGVEGGHMIEDDIAKLDELADRGMRYMTLTWNNSTNWATSAADEEEKGDSLPFKGLTEFGKNIVRRMNDRHVMVDLSHVGEHTFWDAIATTRKPVIVSHSSVYTICPNRRNLKDDQIKAVAKNRGVICVNFYSGFIDSTYEKKVRMIRQQHKGFVDSVNHAISDHWRAETVIDSALMPALNEIRPPLSVLIDHIDYIAKLVGTDYVGLGSDFDGIESLPKEMDDVTFLPNITRELKKRGYSDQDIKKILGENVVRVFRANAR